MGSTLSAEAGAGQSAGNSRDIGRLDPHLQRFVHEGVDYSLRLLIRGDCGTGKSSLALRLRGGPFQTEHRTHNGPIEVSHRRQHCHVPMHCNGKFPCEREHFFLF